DPRSPVVMKEILANVYKSKGDYEKALAIWDAILDDEGQSSQWPRARQQIAEIRALTRKAR
ncbi:MAG TPA: hypothetical protein VN915_11775, partial [Elusimicrobiota bacterium]|nr:hypothetical protein [Elusimicrobiota bacterium]